jgi:hypothetical protein
MADIHLQKEYDVDAARIWGRIEDFFAIHTWLPTVASSEPDKERSTVRHITRVDGAQLTEELVAKSEDDMSIRYRILEGDVPVRDFEGTIVVRRSDSEHLAAVTWDVTFEALVPEDVVVPLISEDLLAGLDNLANLLGQEN